MYNGITEADVRAWEKKAHGQLVSEIQRAHEAQRDAERERDELRAEMEKVRKAITVALNGELEARAEVDRLRADLWLVCERAGIIP